MSIKPWKIVGALAGSVAAISLAYAAGAALLNVKLGLWEITTHPQMSGTMPMSDEDLQKLPPEQRARFQAAMQMAMANAAKPRVFKECMTPEKRSRGFNAGNDVSASCQTTITTNTPAEFEARHDCASADHQQSFTVHFKIVDSDQVTGTVNGVITRGGRTMTVNSTAEGKWLGADCGTVKDVEMERPAP